MKKGIIKGIIFSFISIMLVAASFLVTGAQASVIINNNNYEIKSINFVMDYNASYAKITNIKPSTKKFENVVKGVSSIQINGEKKLMVQFIGTQLYYEAQSQYDYIYCDSCVPVQDCSSTYYEDDTYICYDNTIVCTGKNEGFPLGWRYAISDGYQTFFFYDTKIHCIEFEKKIISNNLFIYIAYDYYDATYDEYSYECHNYGCLLYNVTFADYGYIGKTQDDFANRITDPNLSWTSVKLGDIDASKNCCGAIALHNALRSKGETIDFYDTLNYFNENNYFTVKYLKDSAACNLAVTQLIGPSGFFIYQGVMSSLDQGLLGISKDGINTYLDNYGYTYTEYGNFDENAVRVVLNTVIDDWFDGAIGYDDYKNSLYGESDYIILMANDKNDIGDGFHYVYFKTIVNYYMLVTNPITKNVFRVPASYTFRTYNLEYGYDNIYYDVSSFDEILGNGAFIYGWKIN